jgi:hypothetical protein
VLFLALLIAGLISSYLGARGYYAYKSWKTGEVHKNPEDYGLLGYIAMFQNDLRREKDYVKDLYNHQV